MKSMVFFLWAALLIFPSCVSDQLSLSEDTAAAPALRYIVFPQDIPGDYEVIGAIQVGGEGVSTLSDLHQQLAHQCAKMGGDMVIHVEEGSEFRDSSEIYQRPSGYRELAPPFPPDIEPSYTWGKGTIIRLTNKEQRKAFYESLGQENSDETCAIVGVAPPR